MPMASCSTEEALAWIRKHDLTTFVATVGATIDYAQADYRQRCAIVLGSEAHGVTPEWQSSDLPAISIPMRGIADSLNISASAAVVLYEANRQRSDQAT
jgi:TrmH family RNA methyltransferase